MSEAVIPVESTAPARVVTAVELSPSFDPAILADYVPASVQVLGEHGAGIIQPILDVQGYLEKRRPQPLISGEDALFITLPAAVRLETESLLCAFGQVKDLVARNKWSVQRACKDILRTFSDTLFCDLKTFRAKYDAWVKKKDWVVAVNCAKAGPLWQKSKKAMPGAFLDFCCSRFSPAGRDDCQRQALLEIKRMWRTGRDLAGNPVEIPGYGIWQDWFRKTYPGKPLPIDPPIPEGWSYSNILDQIKQRNLLTKAMRALAQQGTHAAMQAIPGVHSTRTLWRFMERIQFDDVKTDWRVIDPNTGEVCDLWLLIARDVATTMLLGFGMRPARVREDGSQDHLKLKDMKQLLGWLLERYGLPPYLMHWIFECGTATISKAVGAAISELVGPGRIQPHWTSMQGDKSPVGYAERKVGNSRGKAMLESHNRLMHTMGSGIPGQTGPLYTKRPADLAAREKEAVAIWKLTQHLPPNLRSEVGFPILTIDQARVQLRRIFQLQNERTEHKCEGFEEIVEWWDPSVGQWKHQSSAPNPLPPGSQVRPRKEMPIERAARLVRAAGENWTAVSPAVIAAFYEHTQKTVKVNDKGQIEFQFQGNPFRFNNPGAALPAGTELLAYFHEDDPRFLHLTDGRGAFVGTWLREGLVHDEDTLSQAIRYQRAALRAAKDAAERLAEPERRELEAMRARNAELLQSATFIEVAQPDAGKDGRTTGTTPVAEALTALGQERLKAKKAERDYAADEADAKKRLMNKML